MAIYTNRSRITRASLEISIMNVCIFSSDTAWPKLICFLPHRSRIQRLVAVVVDMSGLFVCAFTITSFSWNIFKSIIQDVGAQWCINHSTCGSSLVYRWYVSLLHLVSLTSFGCYEINSLISVIVVSVVISPPTVLLLTGLERAGKVSRNRACILSSVATATTSICRSGIES